MLSPMAKSQSKTTNQFPRDPEFWIFSFYSIFLHHLRWDELEKQQNPSGKQDQVIEVSKHGDKIRNQVNRTEGVGQDDAAQELCVQGIRGSRFSERAWNLHFDVLTLPDAFEAVPVSIAYGYLHLSPCPDARRSYGSSNRVR